MLFMIYWSPWSWKTTTGHNIKKYCNDNGISCERIEIDWKYLDFIKKYDYLDWPSIQKNIQRHFESMNDKIQDNFCNYVINIIEDSKAENIVIEWRHLEIIWTKIKNYFMKKHIIHELFLDKSDTAFFMSWY